MNHQQSSTNEERIQAAVCHIVSIPFPLLGPALFFAANRNRSRFVSLHAAQAFFEQIVLSAVLFICLAISLSFTAASLWELIQTGGESFEWSMVWSALIKSAATWVILGAVSLCYSISSIFDALASLRGEYKPSLISGRLARLTQKQ